MAAAAISNLDEEPERSILLAQHALDTYYTVEAEGALHQALQSSPLRKTLVNEETGSFWLSLSPDGQSAFVSGPGGGTMWDLEAGQVMFTRTVPDGDWINQTTFTPDGAMLLMTGETYDDDTPLPSQLTIVDAASGEVLKELVAHDSYMSDVAVSPDGQLVATASDDLTTKIWDLQEVLDNDRPQPLHTLCCQANGWNFLHFSPSGEQLAASQGDDTAKIWDVESGQELFFVETNASPLAFSPDGDYLVTLSENEAFINTWDAANGDLLSTIQDDDRTIANSISFSPDGSQFVTGRLSGRVAIWDFSPEGPQKVQTLLGHRDQVGGAAFSPDGQDIVSSSVDGTTRIWDISPAASGELGAFAVPTINRMAIAEDGTFVVSVGSDGQLRVWDPETHSEILAFQAHDDEIQGVDVSHDGRLVATAGEDGLAKIWDTVSWQSHHVLEAHEPLESGFFRGLLTVAFNPEATLLATGGVDGAVRIWNVESRRLLHELVGQDQGEGQTWVNNIVFSPDGKLLVSARGDRANIWDVSTGTLLQTLSPVNWQSGNRGFWGMDFNPDGSQLVLGRTDHIMETWDIPATPWQPDQDLALLRQEVKSGSGFLFSAIYSPDGKTIALSGLGTLVEVRDANTGELLLGLSHPAAIRQVLFAPDGRSLFTFGFNELVRVFALDLEALQVVADSRTTRSLTQEECTQYLHLDNCSE